MIIDTHTHINDKIFDNSRSEIINRIKDAKIDKIIETAYDYETIIKSLELSNKYDFIYSTIGIHPSEANKDNIKFYQDIYKLAQNKKVVSIGEIGLDYHYDGYNKDKQKQLFKDQIEIASALELPITLHIRDAYEDSLKILKDMKSYIKNGIYVHCYSASKELVKEYKKYDAFFGFDGPITYPNAKKEEIVLEVGKEFILSETDCPYLTPVPFRGRVNEPKNVILIQEKLANIFNLSLYEIQNTIWNNAHRLLKKLNG